MFFLTFPFSTLSFQLPSWLNSTKFDVRLTTLLSTHFTAIIPE